MAYIVLHLVLLVTESITSSVGTGTEGGIVILGNLLVGFLLATRDS